MTPCASHTNTGREKHINVNRCTGSAAAAAAAAVRMPPGIETQKINTEKKLETQKKQQRERMRRQRNKGCARFSYPIPRRRKNVKYYQVSNMRIVTAQTIYNWYTIKPVCLLILRPFD